MKTETMCIDMLHKAYTKPYHRILVITPYENQVRLVFTRLMEIIKDSPLVAKEVVKTTKNPYWIELANGAIILGFTTGASSGSGGASIRGQRADALYLDEVDYMTDADFDSVMAIAAERSDITVFMSSTPTGARSHFWKACTNKKMGFTEHYHPSMHNPGWDAKMEAELRAQLTEQGYIHEVLAEFGTQEKGVFNKAKVDESTQEDFYTYDELTYSQKVACENNDRYPTVLDYSKENPAPVNPFRCMGVDWDKYQAGSSLLILDYDVILQKFKVIKRVEVPRGEYSYDNAINLVIELNEIYRPSWIYCDAGSGEYQIERLHMYGEEHPTSGLRNKVKRWQFKQSLDITDPTSGIVHKEPMKPFMVTQLQIAFERNKMILSPFDEVLHKQLIDYEVAKLGAGNIPTFSSKDEHFVDALGLSYLAFVLEFPELTDMMKKRVVESLIDSSKSQLGGKNLNNLFASIETSAVASGYNEVLNYDPTDAPSDRPTKVKVPLNYKARSNSGWGTRSSGCSRSSFSGRSMW